jgi:hypothetical protein
VTAALPRLLQALSARVLVLVLDLQLPLDLVVLVAKLTVLPSLLLAPIRVTFHSLASPSMLIHRGHRRRRHREEALPLCPRCRLETCLSLMQRPEAIRSRGSPPAARPHRHSSLV